jgi:hypothetical protein
VDGAVGEKGGWRDWKDAFGVDREHRILPLFGLLLDDDGLGALLASEGEWRQFRLLTLE